MRRDYSVYLRDILEAVGKIRSYMAGLSQQAFSEDSRTIDAVIRNLEIIGEAVRMVPGEVRSAHPDVEWKKIAGLRDILIHRYFGIDLEIVWDVVQTKIPALEISVKEILKQ